MTYVQIMYPHKVVKKKFHPVAATVEGKELCIL